jgi:ADP-heptose:LPS heptosyltransferase
MHGSGTVTNPLAALFGARTLAGFFLPGQFCPDPVRFLPDPAQVPEVWRHLRLMEFLGVPLQGEDLEFPLFRDDRRSLHSVLSPDELRPGNYVCVHPGARAAARRWPAVCFAAVASPWPPRPGRGHLPHSWCRRRHPP